MGTHGPMGTQGLNGVPLGRLTNPPQGIDDHLLENAAHESLEEHYSWDETAHETSFSLGKVRFPTPWSLKRVFSFNALVRRRFDMLCVFCVRWVSSTFWWKLHKDVQNKRGRARCLFKTRKSKSNTITRNSNLVDIVHCLLFLLFVITYWLLPISQWLLAINCSFLLIRHGACTTEYVGTAWSLP